MTESKEPLRERIAKQLRVQLDMPTRRVSNLEARIVADQLIKDNNIVELADDQELPRIPNRMGLFADEIIGECQQTQQDMLKGDASGVWRKVKR